MFSDTLFKYLLEYQKDDFKPEEPKEFKIERKPIKIANNNYATIPINAK